MVKMNEIFMFLTYSWLWCLCKSENKNIFFYIFDEIKGLQRTVVVNRTCRSNLMKGH